MANEYDVVVIGSGTGGYVAAIRAAQLGLRTAVVERAPVLGGTCLNWGCIPTKALLEHAHALKVAQDWKEWGLTHRPGRHRPRHGAGAGAQGQDRQGPHRRHRAPVQEEQDRLDQGRGAAGRQGRGRGHRRRQKQTLTAAKEIIVATGSQPRSVPGIEIDRKRIITSDEAIDLSEVPKSIVILGSGAVGVEFASIFRRFGSEVTIIELLPRLVPIEDEAVSAELEKIVQEAGHQGADRHEGHRREGRRGRRGGRRRRAADGKTTTLSAEYLLVATGRGPVTSGLGAEDVRPADGARLHPRRPRVPHQRARHLRRSATSSRSTSPAIRSSRTCRRPKASRSPSGSPATSSARSTTTRSPAAPTAIPEIGSVGLTEEEAQERGYDVRVGTFKFGVLGRARIAGETEGFVKIVAEKKYDEVLGVHMIGARSTELVAEATLALRLECTVEELIRTIHAHPTMSEAVGRGRARCAWCGHTA